jgi:hypothetical protein
MVNRLRLSCALLLGMALSGAADEVVLHNGAVFSGVVTESGNRVLVRMDAGSISFLKVDVKAILRSENPLQDYERRRLEATDVPSRYALALWAREKGLTGRSNDMLRSVLELDPDHEASRKLLGFEKVDGRWLEGDDILMARGLLPHRGRWLPRETVEKILEQEKEQALEARRRESEERIASEQRSLDRSRLALERERLEIERQRSWSWPWGWSTGFAPGFGFFPGQQGGVRIESSYTRPRTWTQAPFGAPAPSKPPAGTLKP